MSNVLVLGAGGWGIGLALVASRMGHTVTLWSFDEAELEDLRLHNQNKLRLPGVFLPRSVRLTGEMAAAAEAALGYPPADSYRIGPIIASHAGPRVVGIIFKAQ